LESKCLKKTRQPNYNSDLVWCVFIKTFNSSPLRFSNQGFLCLMLYNIFLVIACVDFDATPRSLGFEGEMKHKFQNFETLRYWTQPIICSKQKLV